LRDAKLHRRQASRRSGTYNPYDYEVLSAAVQLSYDFCVQIQTGATKVVITTFGQATGRDLTKRAATASS
jgi:hypothetical protein